MNIINKNDLRLLMEHNAWPCISIIMSGHVGAGGAGVQQDKIKLKNYIRDAEEKLHTNGYRSVDIEKYIAPLLGILDDDGFWQEQSRGLALFCSPDLVKSYRLPISFDNSETVVVGEQFQVMPLLNYLNEESVFYILALSLNNVRLVKVAHHYSQEITLPQAMPTNISTGLNEEKKEQEHLFSGRSERGNKHSNASFDSVYHGDEADEKNEILRFFQLVNHGLQEVVINQKAPMVLAGVDYLLPIYRQANSYHHLCEKALVGNPDELSAGDLHKRAWPIVEPEFIKEREKLITQYQDYHAKGQATNELKKIIKAAAEGRIDALFVTKGQPQWGNFNAAKHSVIIHDQFQPGDYDLLNFAAKETFLRGGAVYALDQNYMPDNSLAAAIYRYMKVKAMSGGTKSK